ERTRPWSPEAPGQLLWATLGDLRCPLSCELPGVRLWCFPWPWPDLVEPVEDRGVESQRERAEARPQFVVGLGTDDRSGDDWVGQQPREREVRRSYAQLSTERFVGIESVAVLVDWRL